MVEDHLHGALAELAALLLLRLDQETIAAKVAERDHGRTVRSAHRQRHCVAVDCDRGEHACCRRDDQPRAVRLA